MVDKIIALIEIDIKNFQSLLKSSNDLENFIHNPTQSVLVQLKVINILSEKLNFSKNLSNFFSLLTEKRRIFFLLKIIESFLKLCSKKRGEIKASLISSKELNDSEIENISKDLSNSIGLKIKIDYKIDKDLIGGLKFQIGSLMVDTSIKNKLKKLEQNMIEN